MAFIRAVPAAGRVAIPPSRPFQPPRLQSMPQFHRRALPSLALAAFAASLALAAPSPAAAEEVYLIRGFMNVFSDGMNQMGRALRARGIRASVHSNGEWPSLASNIISRYRQGKVSLPIIIAGHSVGGVEVPDFANALGKAGVPVRLAIGLDPGFANPGPFGRGVQSVVNYRIPSGHRYRGGAGFSGSIADVNVAAFTSTDHVGIDKNPAVQRRVIAQIAAAVGK
jgi:hypothetical protein